MVQLTPAQQFADRFAQERRLKSARDRHDIDQKAIAEAVGVSESAVSRWESGESVPKDDILMRVAQFFGVTPGWLRYGQEPREPREPHPVLPVNPAVVIRPVVKATAKKRRSTGTK